MVEHLTKVSGGLGSNPGLVRHHLSHPITQGSPFCSYKSEEKRDFSDKSPSFLKPGVDL